MLVLYDYSVDGVCEGDGTGELECNDDASWDSGVWSQITYDVTEGDEYLVVVDSWGSGSGGSYELNINECESDDPDFDPDGDYSGDFTSTLIRSFFWGGAEVRYDCTGLLSGTIEVDDDPQVQANGSCVAEYDGVTYDVEVTGDVSASSAGGTVTWEGDDGPTSTDWSGEWARDELEGEYSLYLGADTVSEWTIEGEFELVRE
jgi:hypothetical protein